MKTTKIPARAAAPDPTDNRPVLVTDSTEIREQVLAAAAAAAVEVRVCADAGSIDPTTAVVLIGPDRAPLMARSAILRSASVHLVGGVADQQRLCEWSAALGATVIVLPEGLRWLTATLAGGRHRGSTGRMVALVGACGGVGTSSLALGVAWAAAQRGHRVALVDLDPGGGGLDLLVGLEQAPGWRWPALLGAEGFLGDLHAQLPRLETMAVLSHDHSTMAQPGPDAVTAVLRSLRRTHDLVVLDAGARPGPSEIAAIGDGDGALLVCSGEVRALAGAIQQLRGIDAQVPLAAVFSRIRQGSHPADMIARTLSLPVVATVPVDKRVAACFEAGEPPGRGTSRGWRQACQAVLGGLQLVGS